MDPQSMAPASSATGPAGFVTDRGMSAACSGYDLLFIVLAGSVQRRSDGLSLRSFVLAEPREI